MRFSVHTSRPIIYRMHVAATSTTFVVALENVTPVEFLMMTVFAPGDLQSVHFLTRTAPGVWSYYGLARTGVSVESFRTQRRLLHQSCAGTLCPLHRRGHRAGIVRQT